MKQCARLSVSVMLLALLFHGCGGNPSGGLRETVITAENQAQVLDQAEKELTVEEGKLVQAYLERARPDLSAGQLPTGLTLGQMIQDQRSFEASATPSAPVESAVSPAEPEAAGKQPAPAEPATPPEAASGGAETPVEEASEPPPPPEPTTAVVSSGTTIPIRLRGALSSKTAQSGEKFEADLDEALMVGDKLVAPRGSTVTGRVLEAAASGKVKGRAKLTLSLESVTVEGKTYSLKTNQLAFEADSTKKKDATRIGVATGIGAAIGAIAGGGKGAAIGAAVGGGAGTGATLLTSGKEVEFGVEQLFNFELRSDVEMGIVKK